MRRESNARRDRNPPPRAGPGPRHPRSRRTAKDWVHSAFWRRARRIWPNTKRPHRGCARARREENILLCSQRRRMDGVDVDDTSQSVTEPASPLKETEGDRRLARRCVRTGKNRELNKPIRAATVRCLNPIQPRKRAASSFLYSLRCSKRSHPARDRACTKRSHSARGSGIWTLLPLVIAQKNVFKRNQT
jgi:hypothetical protein